MSRSCERGTEALLGVSEGVEEGVRVLPSVVVDAGLCDGVAGSGLSWLLIETAGTLETRRKGQRDVWAKLTTRQAGCAADEGQGSAGMRRM